MTSKQHSDLTLGQAVQLIRVQIARLPTGYEAFEALAYLEEQLEAAQPIIEAVAQGKVGPAHGVLARDILNSNLATGWRGGLFETACCGPVKPPVSYDPRTGKTYCAEHFPASGTDGRREVETDLPAVPEPDWDEACEQYRRDTGESSPASSLPEYVELEGTLMDGLDEPGGVVSETPNLDLFIKTTGDEARLALGLGVLQAAWDEARDSLLQGWTEAIYPYLHAVESGKGLNNPFEGADSNQESKP